MTQPKSQKLEQTILWISFGTGVGFAVVEFISAILTESQSVLMDAAYDSSELIIIVLTLFLTPLFHQPISEKHPYGFSQVESIFIIIKSFMMLAVTVSLSANSIQVALSGGHTIDGVQVSLLQLVLGSASVVIYIIMRHLSRQMNAPSPTVDAELLGWKQDIAYSMGLSLAFYGSTFLELTPLAFLAPYFDQMVAVFMVCLTLPETFRMLWRAIQDVFLFSPEASLMDQVKELCQHVLKKYDFEPVFYDITRTGRCLWISVYFRIHEDTLSIRKLRQASDEVRAVLQGEIENCSSELIVVDHDSEWLVKTMSLSD